MNASTHSRPGSDGVSDSRRRRLTRFFSWVAVAVGVALSDQLTKIWVEASLAYHQSVPITPFLNLTLTYNTGAAFSLLGDAGGWQRWLFIGLAVVVGVVLLVWLYRDCENRILLPFALTSVLGGAVGNLWDRVLRGAVVDFIDVHYRSLHWPAFNVADAAICLGAALLIWLSFTEEPGHE